ncbi:MAG: amidohydrolase family protein [Candidatus Cloacimonadales bacterium]
MQVKIAQCVFDSQRVEKDYLLPLQSKYSTDCELDFSDCIAYPPLINSHDHLIGNWYPRAQANNPYDTVDKWVDEMRFTPPFLERNKIWKGNGKFDLTDQRAQLITQLGAYKNLFSGVQVVQDHISYQSEEYYANFPIQVLKEYKQCHSMSMGNWWGGKSAEEEYADSKGELPFIIHLAEGTNQRAHKCFAEFKRAGLLQPNVMLIHGIALSEAEIAECAAAGTSICWCPGSNIFLIGETLDLPACLKHGVNVVIGTDSTMSGSINLLEEMKFGASLFPQIAANTIFQMVTENAQRALRLPASRGKLQNPASDLLILRQKNADAYQNLLQCDLHDIKFFMSRGVPLLGEAKILDSFQIDPENYSFFTEGESKRFVWGKPLEMNQKVNEILGYHKKFPYFPF